MSPKKIYTWIGVFVSISMIALFAWVYALAPFTESLNSWILNGMTLLSAVIGAMILTRITSFFHSGEPPRGVWMLFAISLWFWAIAEGVWAYYYITAGEVPAFSLADVLWLAGYVTLGRSLVDQYRLIFAGGGGGRRFGWYAAGAWLGIFLVAGGILVVTKSEAPMEDFFRYFYLLADSVVGLSALYLVRAFGGRALAMPWLTITSFVVTDVLYAWLTASGVYDWEMSGVSIALLADTLYVASYLIVAWGVFGHYLLLRFGPEPIESQQKEYDRAHDRAIRGEDV